MNGLEKFWKLLELNIDRAALMRDRERVLGDAIQVLTGFLHPTDEVASYYPNPIDPKRQPYRIVQYKDVYSAISDDLEDRINLEPKDVIAYRWDMLRFRKLLAGTLEVAPASDSIKKLECVIRLGHLSLAPGEEYPVYMILVNKTNFFRDDVSGLLFKLKTPFIVTTGTRIFWDANIVELLRERNIPLLPLCEALEFRDGQFVPTNAWHGAIDAFRQVLHPINMVPAPPYEFRKKGDMWVIRFAGEDMYLKDAVGLRCIGQLLAKPNDPVFVSDLKMIIDGQNPQLLPAPTSTGEVVDKQYLKDVAKKYLALEAEHEQAIETGEVALANEIQDEMDQLMTIMKEAKGFGGNTKEANEQLNSIRVSVYRGIMRVLESIKIELPDLYDHLKPRISTGFVLNYVSDNNITWVT